MIRPNDVHALRALVSDRATLLRHLEHADTAPLLMVLVHLGGDPAWLKRIAPHIKGPWSFHDETPDGLRAELREALADVLEDYANTGRALPTELPLDLLPAMLRACTGQVVPPEYYPMVHEEMDLAGTDPKTVHWRARPDPKRLADFEVLVVGAGFSGIGMGIKLKEAGIPFTIVEKNDDVGGTWYENTYPGIGVDTANHFYSYSFDNNNDWDHFFAKGDEIEAYIRRNTERTALREIIRFNEDVLSLRWDEPSLLWHAEIRRKDGSTYTMTANAVVSAVGMLNRPKVPPIKGLETFAGPKFHTARWDHSVDYKGKRVGMIGTGASGMQVGPAIQPFVGNLTIFQRSPHWAMLNPLYFENVTDAKKWVLNNIPFYTKWFRFQLFWSSSDTFHHNLKVDPNWPDQAHSLNAANAAVRKQLEAHIASEVGHDPELIRKATPDYPPYGKRMLRDNHWYRMLTRPNVDLVGIAHSKTDQEGEGDMAWLSPETMGRLSSWLLASGITEGPVFRRINVLATNAGSAGQQIVRHFIGAKALTRQGVVAILRRRVREAIDLGHVELERGMEGETVRSLSAHSFRVGLTKDLFAAGEDGAGIALALRWSSPTTALRYARELAVGAAARVLGKLRGVG